MQVLAEEGGRGAAEDVPLTRRAGCCPSWASPREEISATGFSRSRQAAGHVLRKHGKACTAIGGKGGGALSHPTGQPGCAAVRAARAPAGSARDRAGVEPAVFHCRGFLRVLHDPGEYSPGNPAVAAISIHWAVSATLRAKAGKAKSGLPSTRM